MTDARNVYPRLCWGCLGIINDFCDDLVNLNYGGRCNYCHREGLGDMPGLNEVINGHTERMNSVVERDDLLREAERLERYRQLSDGQKSDPIDVGRQMATYRVALKEVQRLLLEPYPIRDQDYTKLLLRWGESMAVIAKALKEGEDG
jgi:hypothetical protein